MEVKRRRDERQTKELFKVESYSFKKVSEFKYLSIMINRSKNMEHEILKRIEMGSKCYYALSNLFN